MARTAKICTKPLFKIQKCPYQRPSHCTRRVEKRRSFFQFPRGRSMFSKSILAAVAAVGLATQAVSLPHPCRAAQLPVSSRGCSADARHKVPETACDWLWDDEAASPKAHLDACTVPAVAQRLPGDAQTCCFMVLRPEVCTFLPARASDHRNLNLQDAFMPAGPASLPAIRRLVFAAPPLLRDYWDSHSARASSCLGVTVSSIGPPHADARCHGGNKRAIFWDVSPSVTLSYIATCSLERGEGEAPTRTLSHAKAW
jgi:hypothetical protein